MSGTYAAIQRDVNVVKEIAEQEKNPPVRYGLAVFPAPAPPVFYLASFVILKAIIQM